MPDRKLSLVSLNNIIESQINTKKLQIKMQNLISKKTKKINISCDFNQISRLFMNILKNSLESITKNTYNYFKKSKSIYIDIEDNGDGFPQNREKFLNHI